MKWQVPTSMYSTAKIARIDLKRPGTHHLGSRVKWPLVVASKVDVDDEWMM